MSRLSAVFARPFGEVRKTETGRVDWSDFASKMPAAVRLWGLDGGRRYWWLFFVLGPVLFVGGIWMQFFVETLAQRVFELGLTVAGIVVTYVALIGVAPNVGYLQREEKRPNSQP